MDDLNKKSEDDLSGEEIESPVDGPTPDWMRLATSGGSGSSLTEENTPAWLKSVRAGQGLSKDTKSNEAKPATEPPTSQAAANDNMSDLERLLAEEGIDLGSVEEERPEGAEAMSARDWLIATSSEEIIRNKLGATPVEEEPAAPQPLAAAGDESMSDLERLLAEEGIDLGSVEEERPEDAGAMSARDWLIATSSEEIIRNKLGATPIEEEPAAPQPRPAASDDKMVVEGDLPDWLQEIAADVNEAEPSFVAAPTPTQEIEDDQLVVAEELPDWLQEISDEASAAGPADLIAVPAVPVLPAQPAATSHEDKMVVEEDLPDWLQEIAAEPAAAEEPELALPDFAETPAPAAVTPSTSFPLTEDKMVVEEDLPDWLQEFSDESPVAAEVDDLAPTPPVQAIARPVATPIDEDKMVVAEDLPDWLQEIAAEPPVTGELELPDSMEIPTPSVALAQDKAVIEEDLPDWLQEAAAEEALPLGEPELTTPPPPSSADKMIVEEDLPDWLREVEVEPAEPGLTLDSTELEMTPTDLAEEVTDEDLPDWLREVEVDALENNFLMPPLETPADLPTEPLLTSAGLSLEGAFDALDDDEDLPDWLKEVQERDGKGAPEAISPPVPAALDTASPATGLILEDELPDWLKEAQGEPEPLAFEELEAVGQTEQAVEEISAEEDLPDWLREVEIEEAEPFEPSEPSPELLTEGVAEEMLVIEDELPDWLQEVQDELPEEVITDQEIPALATSSVLASDSAANLIDEEGLPDWLKDVEEEPEAAIEEEPLPPAEPVIVASGEPASPLPIPTAEVEEVVEPVEISPVPSVPVLETTPAVVPATSDSIPDWLQKLREVTPDDEQAPVLETRATPQPVLAQAHAEPEPDLPADAEERLKLARTARDKGQLDEAVRIYDSLISRGVYLDKIIADMQQSIKSHPKNYLLFQVMGDAMMKDGRLQSALNAYREALSRL